MNNNNNSQTNAPGRRNRGKRARAPAPAGETSGPPQKKQKSAGQKRRQRNRRAQRDGRALTTRGDMLTAKGSSRGRSGYGNKASMPVWESEYIADIIPTAEPNFSLQTFPVNPGQAGTFPWLSSIAKNFEKYEFEFITFVYKRTVSEFATNGVTGKVIMAFYSDATDVPPVNKQQIMDTEPEQDCMPCENMRLSVPREILQKFNDAHFVRPGAQPANTDLKTFDIGTLFVACQGTAANTAVGELHVEYALKLRVPVLEANLPLGPNAGAISTVSGTVASPFLTPSGVSGNIGISQALTVLTFTGLVIGQEYQVSYFGSSAQTVTTGTYVGWTEKNFLVGNGATSFAGLTLVATAQTASLAITLGGAIADANLTITNVNGISL